MTGVNTSNMNRVPLAGAPSNAQATTMPIANIVVNTVNRSDVLIQRWAAHPSTP